MTYHHVMNYSNIQESQSDSDDDSFVDLWAVVEGTAIPKPYRKSKQSCSMHTHEQSKHIQIPKSKNSPCKVPSRSPPWPSNFEKRSIRPSMNRHIQQTRHQRERKDLRQQETSFDINRCSQGETKSSRNRQANRGRRHSLASEAKSSRNRQANRGRRHSLATSPRREYQQDLKQSLSSSSDHCRSENLGVRRKSLSPKRESYEKGNYRSLSNSEPHLRAFPIMGIEDHRKNGKISNPLNHGSRGVRRQSLSTGTENRRSGAQTFSSRSDHYRAIQLTPRSRTGRRHSLDNQFS
mmetsp:Transcript_32894/g.49645  ORF Transcript_32894/g.49645 Transcript_32894/m.49645 type:complete len:293 (+) Transcript_32894:69-947(+)